MKKIVIPILAFLATSLTVSSFAETDEPFTYEIQKGDTLWGISGRFVKDPFFWPDLWSKNQIIKNPHLIEPGQKLRFFEGRIEVVSKDEVSGEKEKAAPVELKATPAVQPAAISNAKPVEKPEKELLFAITGGEGVLLTEEELESSGKIISSYQNRQISGEDDIVYINTGRKNGVKVGDRYSIYQKSSAISHPLTNLILGYKVIPLGTLRVSEVEEKTSKAIIIKSFQEIAPGSILSPYRDKKKPVPLKAADRDLSGIIVDTKSGKTTVATGDVVYIDLGISNGLQKGNMLYIVRPVIPDEKFYNIPIGKLPADIIGAIVVVETGKYTSTAIVVKSVDLIYRADRVEMMKSR